MTRPALLLCLLAAAPARAGFTVPIGADDVRRLPGVVAYEIRGEERIVFFGRERLAKQIATAARFARRNGGDLPANAFWTLAVEAFRDDPALFARLHQCPPLLALLRADLRHDRPRVLPPLPPAGPVPPGTRPTVPKPPGGPRPQQVVPEPSSLLQWLAAIGVVLAGMAARKTKGA